MYDPATARFLTTDPEEYFGNDSNLYLYAANDPVNITDPTGHWLFLSGNEDDARRLVGLLSEFAVTGMFKPVRLRVQYIQEPTGRRWFMRIDPRDEATAKAVLEHLRRIDKQGKSQPMDHLFMPMLDALLSGHADARIWDQGLEEWAINWTFETAKKKRLITFEWSARGYEQNLSSQEKQFAGSVPFADPVPGPVSAPKPLGKMIVEQVENATASELFWWGFAKAGMGMVWSTAGLVTGDTQEELAKAALAAGGEAKLFKAMATGLVVKAGKLTDGDAESWGGFTFDALTLVAPQGKIGQAGEAANLAKLTLKVDRPSMTALRQLVKEHPERALDIVTDALSNAPRSSGRAGSGLAGAGGTMEGIETSGTLSSNIGRKPILGVDDLRQMGNRGVRNTAPLTAAEEAEIWKAVHDLGLDPADVVIVGGPSRLVEFPEFNVIGLGPNAFPSKGGPTTRSVFERLTPRAVLAHEAGHMITTRAGTAFPGGSLLDEFQASIVGRGLPGLNSTERYQLLRDAVERARTGKANPRDLLEQLRHLQGK